MYNYFNDPRNWVADATKNLRGTQQYFKEIYMPRHRMQRGRWYLGKRKRTKSRVKSSVRQRSITAPVSRTIDTKYKDTLVSLTGIKNTASQSASVGTIAQGSGEGQRIGNDVRILKILVTWQIKHGSSTNDQTFRLIIVRGITHNTDSDPGINNIVDVDQAGNRTPLSFRNVLSIEDFEILLDKTVRVDSNYSSSHGVRCNNYEINCAIPQRYGSSAATSIIRNPIWAYVLTDQDNATTGASGQLNFRLIFSDV